MNPAGPAPGQSRAIYAIADWGGEAVFLRSLSSKTGLPLRFFWSQRALSPIVASKRFAPRFIRRVMTATRNPRIRRLLSILYKYILVSMDEVPEDIAIVSTAFMPIPRGRHVIARICTPPRMVGIDAARFRDDLRRASRAQYVVGRIFLMLYRRVYARSLRHAAAFVTISEEVRARLSDEYGIESTRIYSFILPEQFARTSREKYFLWVSRLVRAKRLELAIRAFEGFCRERRDFRLVVVGSLSKDTDAHESQRYLAEAKALVDSLGLPVDFRIDLDRSGVIESYSRAYACLYTAENEDLGIVPLEAMASEAPVLAMNEGGPRETVVDGSTGYLVGSEEEMTERMLRLAERPDLADALGRQGRRHVVEHFSDTVLIPEYERIIGLPPTSGPGH